MGGAGGGQALDTINRAIRYLTGDGPNEGSTVVRHSLLTPVRCALQDTVTDAAHGLGLRSKTKGPWGPVLPHQLLPGETVWARLTGVPGRECPMYQRFVHDTSATTAKIIFHSHHGSEKFLLGDTKDQGYALHPPVMAVQRGFGTRLQAERGHCLYMELYPRLEQRGVGD